jgi:hypothetical protein
MQKTAQRCGTPAAALFGAELSAHVRDEIVGVTCALARACVSLRASALLVISDGARRCDTLRVAAQSSPPGR